MGLKSAAAIMLAGTASWTAPVMAQSANQARTVDIPAGPLGNAMVQLGRKMGVMIAFNPALTRDLQTQGLQGSHTPATALDRLLAGSGLQARSDGRGGFTIIRAPAPRARKSPTRSPAPAPSVRSREAAPVEVAQAAESEEIVVTGFTAKEAQNGLFGTQAVLDTPFSITSYTDDLFRAQQARTVTDVIANDPSVRSNLSASSESEQYVLRGFPLFASEVAVEGLFGMLPIRRIPIEPFAKVEIFRGPNALVNGVAPFGNIGGMINLIPKRAEDRRTLSATASYLSAGQFGGHIDVGGRVGADRSLGIRLNAAGYKGDLDMDFTNRRAGIASLALDYKTGNLQLTADLLYSAERLMGQDYHLTAAGGFQIPDAPDSKLNFGQPWTRTTNESKRFILGAKYEIVPGTTVMAKYGYLDFDEQYRYVQGQLTGANGNFTARFSPFASRSIDQTGEIALRSNFETGPVRHRLVASATRLFIESFGNPAFPATATFTNNIYNPVYVARPDSMFNAAAAARFDDMRHTSDRKLSSIAIADTLSAFDERVLLTVGLRHQNAKLTSFDRVTGAVTSTYNKSKTTPAVGLVVKPQDNWSFYGSFAQGLTPGLFAPAGSANTGSVFAPSVSTQYEIGSKIDVGPLDASIALFRINQPFGYVQPATNLFVIDGDVVNRGVEINLSGKPVKGLTLLGGLLYSDAEQQGTAGGLTDGERPIGVPKWQLNMFAEYEPALLPGFAVNGRVIHTGRQFYDAANLRPIDSWQRFDLGARYAFDTGSGRYTIRGSVENVADGAFWQSASRGFLTRGSPRTFRLSLEAAF